MAASYADSRTARDVTIAPRQRAARRAIAAAAPSAASAPAALAAVVRAEGSLRRAYHFAPRHTAKPSSL
jgi:hypothetical protein